LLRTARWIVGSGGGTADPGRVASGIDSFVSILRERARAEWARGHLVRGE
jgi:hypothetical protein